MWSRLHFLNVPSVLMSRPQLHVATSLSSFSPSFLVATSVFGCDHFAVCMMTSCCDSDSFGRNCVGGLLIFITFNFMSRHHDDVATSFASHSFSLVCNLSSTLQLISLFPLIFQVATSDACRDINFFCSAFFRSRPKLVVAISCLILDL